MHKTLMTLGFIVATTLSFAGSRDYTERAEYLKPLAAGGRLIVHGEIGDIRIRTSDRRDVKIVVIKKARTDDDHVGAERVKEMRVLISSSAGEVSVTGEWPSRSVSRMFRGETNLQMDFEIDAPRDVRVEVRSNIGDVHIEGVGGDVSVTHNIGDVNVSGSFKPRMVRLETGIGEVQTNLPGKTSGWIGKKFTAILDGEYSVNVRLHIGEIRVNTDASVKGRKTADI